MKISKKREGFLVAEACSGSMISIINRLPFRGKWRDRDCIFKANLPNIEYLNENLPDDIEWEEEAKEIVNSFLSVSNPLSSEAKDEDFVFKRSPRAHQLKNLKESCDRENFAYLMEQGTGKTKIVIDNACYLHRKGEINTLLVVAWPTGVHVNWTDYELDEDCSMPFLACSWSPNHKTKSKRVELDNLVHCKFKGLKVMTYNIDAMRTEAGQQHILEMLKNNPCMLAIDQSACIKNPSAERTKFLIHEARNYAKYRRILDGDPASEGAEELYSQFYFLDPRIIGHTTWGGFKQEFCIEKSFGNHSRIIGYRSKNRLFNLIDPHCCRDLAKDCQDLPERIYHRWQFELSAKERKCFDDLKKKNISYFEEKSLDVSGKKNEPSLMKNMRLQQVSAGVFPFKTGNTLPNGNDEWDSTPIGEKPSRLIALMKLLDQIEGKALIFCRFTYDVAMIKAAIPGILTYDGSDTQDQREKNKKEFLQNPSQKLLLGKPLPMGIGHTFVNANNVIFYNNQESLRMRTESEKRCHRGGQVHNVHIWDICGKRTQDLNILASFRRKRDLSSEILRDVDNFFGG